MAADRNRVQAYLDSQREPSSSALEVGLFLRDLTDPSTPDDALQRDYQERRARGESDEQIGQGYLGAAQKQTTQDWVKRRGELIKANTDERARNQALAEAETGVQSVARILGEMANAYRGGKPGEITATIRKHRDAKRDRADRDADQRLGLELEGLEGERQDAARRDALGAQAERDRRQASRQTVRDQEQRNFQAGRDERADERARLDRESREQIARDNRAARPERVNPYDPNRPRTRSEQDAFDRQQGELQTPYGAAQDKQSADALRKFSAAANSLRGQLAIMKSIRDKYKGGFQGVTSAERASDQAIARQAAADALLATKDMNTLGVLSATDYTILNALLPQDPSAWTFGAGDSIMAKIDGAIASVDAKEKASVDAYLKRGSGKRDVSVTVGGEGGDDLESILQQYGE